MPEWMQSAGYFHSTRECFQPFKILGKFSQSKKHFPVKNLHGDTFAGASLNEAIFWYLGILLKFLVSWKILWWIFQERFSWRESFQKNLPAFKRVRPFNSVNYRFQRSFLVELVKSLKWSHFLRSATIPNLRFRSELSVQFRSVRKVWSKEWSFSLFFVIVYNL